MEFSEKLKDIMSLSGTGNKELAREIHVDPSRISQLRTGMRGIPKDKSLIHSICDYLGSKIVYDAQKQMLSEYIKDPSLPYEKDSIRISNAIYRWFCDSTIELRTTTEELHRMEYVNRVIEKDEAKRKKWDAALDSSGYVSGGVQIRLTNEDKRNAVRRVLEYLENSQEPCEIYCTFEENATWYLEDPIFWSETVSIRKKLAERGFHAVHIISDLDAYGCSYDVLEKWIPLYMSGAVSPYYYPRSRDGVFRHSFIIVPGKVAFYSSSIGNEEISSSIIFSESEEYSAHLWEYFQKYLAMCQPAAILYDEMDIIRSIFYSFRKLHARTIRAGYSLSSDTMPISRIMREIKAPIEEALAKTFMEQLPSRGEIWVNYGYVDVCQLATAEQVRSGKVPMLIPGWNGTAPIYYTPKTYAMHLKSILRLMDTYDTYYFVPTPFDGNNQTSILIKEGIEALILEPKSGRTYEIRHPNLVETLTKQYLDYAHMLDMNYRARIRLQVQRLVNELEEGVTIQR